MECLLCARPGLRYQAHGVTYQNRCAPCSVECILLCGKTVNASKQANKINAVCGQCCEEKKQGTKRGASGSREKEQHEQRPSGGKKLTVSKADRVLSIIGLTFQRLLSCLVATSSTQLRALITMKYDLKFSSSVTRATFQVFSSPCGLWLLYWTAQYGKFPSPQKL